MDIDFVRRYIRDAHRAHRVCVACLGVLNDGGDLLALARAARKREISWQGEATGPDGPAYQYRVHGSGYSFVDLRYGTAIHFDVSEAEGIQNIRFGASELFRYASSIGESISEENVRSELTRLSVEEPSLVHVVDGPFYYFYVPTKE